MRLQDPSYPHVAVLIRDMEMAMGRWLYHWWCVPQMPEVHMENKVGRESNHKGATRENLHEDTEQWGEEEKVEVHQTCTTPRQRHNNNIVLTQAPEGQRKRGRPTIMWRYTTKTKYTCQGNVETICGFQLCVTIKAQSRQMRYQWSNIQK